MNISLQAEIVPQVDLENARDKGDETYRRGYVDYIEHNFTDLFDHFNADEHFTDTGNKNDYEEVPSRKLKSK